MALLIHPPATATFNEREISAAFFEAMRRAGLEPPDSIIPDGRLHRFSSNGKRGDDSGWYVLHADGIPAGAFGDWRTSASHTWRADLGRSLTPEEEEAQRRRIDEYKRQAEQERQQRAQRAADRATALWNEAKPAGADHPYLIRKGIAPTETLCEIDASELVRRLGYQPQARGEPLQGRVLLVPVRVGSKLSTLELIDDQGRKAALAGGRKAGGFWATGKLPERGRVLLCEGVATALSLHIATGDTAVAALSAGNLRAVAEELRRRGLNVLLCADLDKRSGEPFPLAMETAQALDLPLAAPVFKDRGDATDFNDLHVAEGLEAVRQALGREASPAPTVKLLSAADVQPEAVNWLWDGWLARGKLHLLAGRPGGGKTTIAAALAATVTMGGRWPDGTRCATPGDVVIWSGEDDPADTLVPRLMAAGADRNRVHFVGGVAVAGQDRTFDPAADMPLLAGAFERVKPALLIVDPIVSAVAADSHKNTEVRRALQPLVDIAAKSDCAVLGITHLSKGTAGRDPTERITGSIAFAAVARVTLLAAKREEPPAGEAQRILVRSKSNIGPDDGGVGYDLEQTEAGPGLWASRVKWAGVIEGAARQLLAEAESSPDDAEGGSLADAVGFLRALLSDGPLPAKRVFGEAKSAGHSLRTIRRAKDRLKVEARKSGMQGGWVWELPAEGVQENPKMSTFQSMDTFGNVGHLRAMDRDCEPVTDDWGADEL